MTSFDRAASFYDATRGVPPAVEDAVAQVLLDEVAHRGVALEIGVGTGLIALPLHRRGARLIGADIAPAMLGRLVAKAGGSDPFPLLLADVTEVPLVDAAVGSVIASHVLHLLRGWRKAVDEAMRVLAPGGTLLVHFADHPLSPWSAATDAVFAGHGIVRRRIGAEGPDEVSAHLGTRASPRPLEVVRQHVRRTLAQDLSDWEQQTHSWTWPYSPTQLRAATTDIRQLADDEQWPLDDEVDLVRTIQWWAFDRTG